MALGKPFNLHTHLHLVTPTTPISYSAFRIMQTHEYFSPVDEIAEKSLGRDCLLMFVSPAYFKGTWCRKGEYVFWKFINVNTLTHHLEDFISTSNNYLKFLEYFPTTQNQ